jgi:hypothetical protein
MVAKQPVGDRQSQHRIAQELHLLIAAIMPDLFLGRLLMRVRTVRQRAAQQQWIGKVVADAQAKRVQLLRLL